MSQASQKIVQQYKDGGVVPAQLPGQSSASKKYVDDQLAIRDENIAVVKNSADASQKTVDNHKTSTTAHPAQNITYSGQATGRDVKQALDGLDIRINNLILAPGDSGPEVKDARGGYPVLGARLDEFDRRVSEITYSVKGSGLVGDGIKDDYPALNDLIASINSEPKELFFPKGTYVIGSDITIPQNIKLAFAEGAMLLPNIDVSITINGEINAGLSKIFAGNGLITGSPKVPCVYPQWFGADETGRGDSTEAIQKSVNLGDCIFIPFGSYTLSDQILVHGEKRIVGAGQYNTNLVINGTDTSVFILTEPGSVISDIAIKHSGDTPTTGAAIEVLSSNSTVNNVFIQGVYDGIRIDGSGGQIAIIKLNQIHIDTFEGVGIYASKVNDVYLDNFIINSQNKTALAGIRLVDKVEAFTVSNGDVLRCAYSMNTDASVRENGKIPAYCKFSSVYFDSSVNGVLLDKVAAFTFTNCWFSNRPNNGCLVQSSDTVEFVSCDFINNGSNGLLIQSSAKRVKVKGGNVISNNSENNGSHGIVVASGTNDFGIMGVTITNGLGFAGLQQRGILVNGGASDRYIITNNLVSGNVVGGVTDGGTGTNKNVSNNF